MNKNDDGRARIRRRLIVYVRVFGEQILWLSFV
jgi:hypothetical protein